MEKQNKINEYYSKKYDEEEIINDSRPINIDYNLNSNEEEKQFINQDNENNYNGNDNYLKKEAEEDEHIYKYTNPSNEKFVSFGKVHEKTSDSEISTILENLNEPLKSYIYNLQNNINKLNEQIDCLNNEKNKFMQLENKNDENEILISKLKMDNQFLQSKIENLTKEHENEIQFLYNQNKNEIQTYKKIINEQLNSKKLNYTDSNFEKIKNLQNEKKYILNNFYNTEKENRALKNQIEELKISMLEKDEMIKTLKSPNSNLEVKQLIKDRNKLLEENNELTSGIQNFNIKVKETREIFKNKNLYFIKAINSYKNKLTEYKNKIIILKKKVNELTDELNFNHGLTKTFNQNNSNFPFYSPLSVNRNELYHNKMKNKIRLNSPILNTNI